MNHGDVQKIKSITHERDIAKSVMPPCYYYHIEKAYRHAIVKIIQGDLQSSSRSTT